MDEFTRGFNLGWLGAAVEYEGAIGIRVLRHKEGKLGFSLHPYVEVYNTDKRLVQKVFGCVGFGYVRVEGTRNPKHKPRAVFALNSRKDIVRFLEIVEPYLISKKERAQLLMEFCRSRLKAMGANDSTKSRGGLKTPYSEKELELARKIRQLITKESGSSHEQSHVLAGF